MNRKWDHMLYVRYGISRELDYMGTRIPWITGCEPADDFRVQLMLAYPNVDAFENVYDTNVLELEQQCCQETGASQCPMGWGGFDMREGVSPSYINAKLKPWLGNRPPYLRDDPAGWLRGDTMPCPLKISDDMWIDSLDTCADGRSMRAVHNARVGLPPPPDPH